MQDEPVEPRITDDTDEVVAGLIHTVEYLDCFRMFAFEEEPDWGLALSYLDSAVEIAQDTLETARDRGHLLP